MVQAKTKIVYSVQLVPLADLNSFVLPFDTT